MLQIARILRANLHKSNAEGSGIPAFPQNEARGVKSSGDGFGCQPAKRRQRGREAPWNAVAPALLPHSTAPTARLGPKDAEAGELKHGVGDGIRTRDVQIHSLALYQLSYTHRNCGTGRPMAVTHL